MVFEDGVMNRLDCSRVQDLGKSLLEFCSPAEEPLFSYRTYLEKSLNLNVNHANLASMADELLAKFYQLEQPLYRPKYFDYMRRGDLAMLESAMSRRFVIVQRIAGGAYRDDRWNKFHDTRINAKIDAVKTNITYFFVLDTSDDDCKVCCARGSEEKQLNCWTLYHVRPNLGECLAGKTETYLPNFLGTLSCVVRGQVCYYSAISCLLDSLNSREMAERKVCSPDVCKIQKHHDLCHLSSSPDAFSRLFHSRRESQFILATHVKCHLRKDPYRTRTMPSAQVFYVLCVVRDDPGPDRPKIVDLPVVCITNDGDAYLLKGNFASFLKRGAPDTRYVCAEPFPYPASELSKTFAPTEEEAEDEITESGEVSSSSSFPGLKLFGRRRRKASPSRGTQPGKKRASGKRKSAPSATVPDLDASEQEGGSGGCGCRCCERADEFRPNMSRLGPQKLYRCAMPVFDLLRMLGWDSPEYVGLVNAACELSICSFDIETMTVPVDDRTPHQDLNYPDTEDLNPDGRLPHKVKATQRLAKIGYTDQLMMMADEDHRQSKIFTLSSEEELEKARKSQKRNRVLDKGHPHCLWKVGREGRKKDLAATRAAQASMHTNSRYDSPSQMLTGDFVDFLLQRRTVLGVEKLNILRPIFNRLHKYYDAHRNFYDRALGLFPPESNFSASRERHYDEEDHCFHYLGDDGGDADDESYFSDLDDVPECCDRFKSERMRMLNSTLERGWEHTLFGKIQAKLSDISDSMYVYAMNGEGYDLCILSSMISVHLKSIGSHHVRMQKMGFKVRSMSFNRIHLTEAKHLTIPGTSLASMGRTCGLQEEKFVFPYEAFNSLDFLLWPELPKDPAAWKSSLSGRSPTPEEVANALKLFKERGYSNINQYLDAYLRADLVILQKSLIILNREYFEVLGVNFIDVKKSTISGLATVGGHARLVRQKCIGSFFPNHCKKYQVSHTHTHAQK